MDDDPTQLPLWDDSSPGDAADAATADARRTETSGAPALRAEGNTADNRRMSEPFGRLDLEHELYRDLLPLCRLKRGEIWNDSVSGHRVGVLDASSVADVTQIAGDRRIALLVNDPPYNLNLGGNPSAVIGSTDLEAYMRFSRAWVHAATSVLADDAHMYVWIGADVKRGFQPLPDFMMMMRDVPALRPRNLITMRNQRGYGTQKNWMWVRQELLHYTTGQPPFEVVYTDIPKILRGYYKEVGGKRRENVERSRSETIRPGNVWVDVQQVFYRREENVPGAYAQKPLAAIERIVATSSRRGDTVMDGFAHSGTTVLAGERLGRRVLTFDIDPVFAELTIRRLEHFRRTGRTGFQCGNPFPEIDAGV
jgi:site-specific DNA-methyltransferase (adenine-specific)